MTLITPDKITFSASISEDELRDRLGREVLQSIGALDPDGTIAAGVAVKVNRGDGRKGGYTITVSGPAPARLALGAKP